ncbi:hypothetical protein JCM5296_006740 [Sporobolomyces johnsonii]
MTHCSTDPSSAFPSPRTPFSAIEDFFPPSHSASSRSLFNYPPVPYPPSAAELYPFWAIPPLALDPSVACSEPQKLAQAQRNLDLTLTLPMLPAFSTAAPSTLAPSPYPAAVPLPPDVAASAKVEEEDEAVGAEWWEQQVRDGLLADEP